MLAISPYLTFNGNCRKAMMFYRDCLGGRLDILTLGESMQTTEMPGEMKEVVLHATLSRKNLHLLATDMVGNQGLNKGNSVALMLHCSSENELRSSYAKLASHGRATYPPEKTSGGALFGGLTDQFGVLWWLHCPMKNDNSNGRDI